MQTTLEDFFRALRGSELAPSLAAQLDAGRAVGLVGWHDRALLKSALGATLAKTMAERALCDEVFERYFHFDAFAAAVPADAPASAAGEAAGEGMAGQGAGAGGSGGGQGASGGAATLAALLQSNDTAALAGRLQQAARDVGLNDIWFFTQRGYYTQRIQQAMGLATLDNEIAQATHIGATQRVQRLEDARQRLFVEVREFVDRRLALLGRAPTQQLRDEHLLSQRLSTLEQRDFARIRVIVERLARRLAERHARRRRRHARGALDLRRTLRANAAHDGVMFRTVWRRKVVERPRVLALCDVSGSVRRHARFLLLFLYSLAAQLNGLRSFAFTDHLVEVSDLFGAAPVEQALDQVMARLGGGSSDYGQMLRDLEAQVLDGVDRRCTVLILGDARNNGGAPQTAVMRLLYQRARRVVWLNPEPASSWGSGDSEMRRYAAYCHVVRECGSIRQLERTLDALLRTNAATA